MVVLVVDNIHQIQLPLPILQPHLLQQLLGNKKISYKADLQAHCNSLSYGFHLRFEDAQAALQQVPMLMMIMSRMMMIIIKL